MNCRPTNEGRKDVINAKTPVEQITNATVSDSEQCTREEKQITIREFFNALIPQSRPQS